MSKLTLDSTMSVDGFIAGPNQTLDQPLGRAVSGSTSGSMDWRASGSATALTDGIESALEQARAAAGDKDVAVAGGASQGVFAGPPRAGILSNRR